MDSEHEGEKRNSIHYTAIVSGNRNSNITSTRPCIIERKKNSPVLSWYLLAMPESDYRACELCWKQMTVGNSFCSADIHALVYSAMSFVKSRGVENCVQQRIAGHPLLASTHPTLLVRVQPVTYNVLRDLPLPLHFYNYVATSAWIT
jgi:hypothetical protein